MLSEVQRQPTHESVQERVTAYILGAELRPGDKLPSENELARRLGVSRNSVREALRGLEATGMIEARHGIGRYVKTFEFQSIADHLAYSLTVDLGSIHDLLDVREALELAFLPAAIASATPDQLRDLEAQVATMRGAPTPGCRSAPPTWSSTARSSVASRIASCRSSSSPSGGCSSAWRSRGAAARRPGPYRRAPRRDPGDGPGARRRAREGGDGRPLP
jgi:DNA-binding FadR family transcriptional regulator